MRNSVLPRFQEAADAQHGSRESLRAVAVGEGKEVQSFGVVVERIPLALRAHTLLVNEDLESQCERGLALRRLSHTDDAHT
jgi:hypothetical protein